MNDLLRYRNNLIYGPSGSGKTYLLGTAMFDERTAPILVLDFEGGSVTLEGSGATIVPIRDWQDYSDIYNTLANNHNTVDGIEYRSLAIDSVSETHMYSLMNAVDDRVKKFLAENKTERIDPNKTELQDFGTALIQMRRFLRSFRDLPLHTFVTSLTKTESLPREGSVRLPSCFGQLAEELCGMYDCVGYLAMLEDPKAPEQVHRVLLLQNQKGVRAKIRTQWGVVAPDKIVDPTITALLDAFQVPVAVS